MTWMHSARRGPVRKRRRWVLNIVVALVAIGAAWAVLRVWQAGTAGLDGKRELVLAEGRLDSGDLGGAQAHLERAAAAFRRTGHDVRTLGPLGPMLRDAPIARVQIR